MVSRNQFGYSEQSVLIKFAQNINLGCTAMSIIVVSTYIDVSTYLDIELHISTGDPFV